MANALTELQELGLQMELYVALAEGDRQPGKRRLEAADEQRDDRPASRRTRMSSRQQARQRVERVSSKVLSVKDFYSRYVFRCAESTVRCELPTPRFIAA